MQARELTVIIAGLNAMSLSMRAAAHAGENSIINGRPTSLINPGALLEQADKIKKYAEMLLTLIPDIELRVE